MEQGFLSNTELYYGFYEDNALKITGDELHHLSRVMRHQKGDEICITDGRGTIFRTEIVEISKECSILGILEKYEYDNPLSNITVCVPRLKNPDRFEFALEKMTELGITNIIITGTQRCVSKIIKKERWEKLVLSAMKQSLRPYKPAIEYTSSVEEIMKKEGRKIVFEQNAPTSILQFRHEESEKYFFIFGPEGGLTDEEINLVTGESRYQLTKNRLRSETAIVTLASYLSLQF